MFNIYWPHFIIAIFALHFIPAFLSFDSRNFSQMDSALAALSDKSKQINDLTEEETTYPNSNNIEELVDPNATVLELKIAQEDTRLFSSERALGFIGDYDSFLMGEGFGDIYLYPDNFENAAHEFPVSYYQQDYLTWIGQLTATEPKITTYLHDEKRIRIYYGFLFYDIHLVSNGQFVKAKDIIYGVPTPGLAFFCRALLDSSQQEEQELEAVREKMLEQTWPINDGRVVIDLPYLEGNVASDTCLYWITFGSVSTYRLNISSAPNGATIIINGQNYGRTPRQVAFRSRFGRLRIRFRKNGYLDKSYELRESYLRNENISDLDLEVMLNPIP